jgi:hypothetical protein
VAGALAAASLFLVAAPGLAQERAPEGLLGPWPVASPGALDDARIEAALREALTVAADLASALAGRHDGYHGNAAIRIALPDTLRAMARGARAVGQGDEIDAFVLAMNRAAEAAAPAARVIVRNAVAELTLPEPRRLLDGGATAVTDALRAQAADRMREAFQPAVAAALGRTGAARQYQELFGRLQALPFVSGGRFDLDRYVTDRALAGFLHLLGEEERRIRLEPTARTSELLRQVFGSRKEGEE